MPLTVPEINQKLSTSSSSNTSEYSRPASRDEDRSFTIREYPQPKVENRGAVLSNFIYPGAPSHTQRYDLKRTVEDIRPRHVVQPLTVSFPPESTLPPGWEQHVHPEGLPYFVLSLPAGGQMQRIVTEEWIYDPDISALIRDFITQIQDAISKYKVTILPESDLVVELHRTGGKLTINDGHAHCGYYFVHHPSRCIYWLEEVTLHPDTTKALNSVWGDLSGYQAQLCLEVEYWTHWNHFPTLHSITPDIYNYIVDIIMGVMTDVISAPQNASTVFTYESLHRMMKVVRMAKDCNTSTWHIGRFMMELTRDRLRNYYGSWGTRLNKDQSVIRDQTDSHSITMDIISPLLFFIPHALLERAEALMTDRRFIMHEWEDFFDSVKEEWNQTALLATIILTANCAFLAIPIFQNPDLVTHSSAEQIASYLSITTSLFGLVISLVMYRHHKSRRANSPAEILSHIHGKYVERFSYVHWEHLFLVWSLPHALVMWSATAFSAAFLLMCLLGTATAAKVTVGVCAALLGSFTFYYIVKFGSGKKLLRIWFRRILQHMRDMRSFCHQSKWQPEEESQIGTPTLND